jgi:Domain of unknown function (DU1801)
MKALDNFYLELEEPNKGCMLALRDIILTQDADISTTWKYGLPFFCYKGKMFCYLWKHKKYHLPYIGFVEGNKLDFEELIIEKRARMKIMLIDPNQDLPLSKIKEILNAALELYKSGIIKIK